MAVRTGDRILYNGQTFQIKCIVKGQNALKGSGEIAHASIGDPDDAVIGVTRWHVQKLQHALENQASAKKQLELLRRPPLGFFDIEHAIPFVGQWLIEYNPANVQQRRKNAIESRLVDQAVAHSLNGRTIRVQSR